MLLLRAFQVSLSLSLCFFIPSQLSEDGWCGLYHRGDDMSHHKRAPFCFPSLPALLQYLSPLPRSAHSAQWVVFMAVVYDEVLALLSGSWRSVSLSEPMQADENELEEPDPDYACARS